MDGEGAVLTLVWIAVMKMTMLTLRAVPKDKRRDQNDLAMIRGL